MLDFSIAGHSAGEIMFLLAAALVAGLARGFSGFGAALIFIPLASAAIGPRLAVPLLLVIDFVMTVGMLPGAWRLCDRRDVGTMAVGAFLGVPAGAYVLANADPLTIRWAIVGLVVIMLGLLVSGWRYHGRPKPPVTVAVGLAAGFCSGAAQAGGPPVVAYWLGGAIERWTVRANIVIYFAVSSLFSIFSYVAGGLLVREVFLLALLSAPAYGLGLFGGSHMFGLASETTFRRICYWLIAAAALVSLPVLDGILR
ncbi:sulfite exporter TauE/SafE family protein [Mesorhizobium sp. LHD-90]|uniref:sulfite exporter TauE/SafE family protein n=1 Tax=Mesorhizobium sp. LHD-90 TaxID=3071414 RepID=UPI0027DFEB6A|nr:sulfite exporter TauE/SafE family protein [Mesorhizobium sp. LHD-90]MDQ6436724.1 sulfite exporter TauE/SafE family protein [Mesorhizobium sp. LHD-90]